ncbi:hypothetical protein CAPTEDRAFT_195003 [Capitella teleta]|uniref:Uncharacterized protein n=1 Tax=Capitella teleta TaxID=283909 RepID=R7VI71_CAPTE|nr:hypothetical protein CAPTEDRAFT_195003 [Capitella teleta]|eukprot:ELU16001.1 hypothetical protein CAPTEDRAFT_195003 [Capitella teleta]
MDRYKSRHRKMLMRHHRSYVIGKRRVRRYLEEKMCLTGHARGNANKLDPPVPHPPEAMPNVQRHFGLATWKELVKSCSENHEVYQNGSIKASLLDSSPSFMVKKCKIRRKQYARRKLRVNVDFVVNPTGSAMGELSGAVTLPVTCLMVRGQGPRIVSVGRPVLKNER